MNMIVELIGFMLFWAACDVKRNEDTKIEIFSKEFFIQMILISIGGFLINNF